MAAWVLTLVTSTLLPLRIVGQGFLPTDDALRHAAKAIANRPWSEILVLRPDAPMDAHVIWHTLLRGVHLISGCDADALVVLAVVALALGLLLAPLPWLRAPEAWLAAWLLILVADGMFIMRLVRGRPYLVSMAVMVSLMMLWTRGRGARTGNQPARWALTLLLFSLAAGLHGSWYLLCMIPFAFACARRLRAAMELTVCWLGGSILAALLTGNPIDFLVGQVRHMLFAMSSTPFTPLLVSEFQSSRGGGLVAVIWFLIVGLWAARGRRFQRLLRDPVFIMALTGWVLGLRVSRFWADWGLPCAAIWMACRMEPWFHRMGRHNPGQRLALTSLICASLLLITSADVDARWSNALRRDYLTPEHPDLTDWLPDTDGIFYAAWMGLFFETFFKNPTADWRYSVGFEPALMPPEDHRIYLNIRWNDHDLRTYEPWVANMTPADRLAIRQRAGAPPHIPELEWYYAARDTWIGRLPRTDRNAPGTNPEAPDPPIGVQQDG